MTGIRVLLVEDYPAVMYAVEKALVAAPSTTGQIEVVTATRLDEALARLAREEFDCILLDLFLPDSSGLDTFRAIRPAARGTPIVIVTSLHEEEAALQSVREGAHDYLMKREIATHVLPRAVLFAVQRATRGPAHDAEERALLDSLPVAVYRANAEGRIERSNAQLAQMLGYDTAADLNGTSLWDTFASAEERNGWLYRIGEQQQITGFERAVKRRSGEQVRARESVRALHAPDGALLSYDGVIEPLA